MRKALLLLGLCALGGILLWRRMPGAVDERIGLVERGPYEQWTPLHGELVARDALSVRAELDGSAKLTWVIEDGMPVQAGELIARFDPSSLEAQKITLQRDLRMAEAELRALKEARHPLELQRIRREAAEIELEWREQQKLLKDTRELVEEELLPEEELEAITQRVAALQESHQGRLEELNIIQRLYQPALEEQALARLEAAQAEMKRVEGQLKLSEVRAARQGTVTRPWIPLDGERRPVRVGDALYRNQVFLELANLTQLHVQLMLREEELPQVLPGMQARLSFPSRPQDPRSGQVFRVGSRPVTGQKRYPAEILIDGELQALRPGLSVRVDVLSARWEELSSVPRDVLQREGDHWKLLLEVQGAWVEQSLTRVASDAERIWVEEALPAGARVRRP